MKHVKDVFCPCFEMQIVTVCSVLNLEICLENSQLTEKRKQSSEKANRGGSGWFKKLFPVSLF